MAAYTPELALPSPRPQVQRKWKIWQILLITPLVLILAALIVLYRPLAWGDFSANPSPAANYQEAIQRIEVMKANEGDLNPDCTTTLLTHGQSVERAIVLIHGFTTCPAQFNALGQQFYERGYNVLIAPLPQHGSADRMTTAQERLTAEEIMIYGDEVADIAQGLGGHVTVAGLSLGGLTAAWIAQNRSDVDLTVLIAPALGFHAVPEGLEQPVTNYYLIAPNSYMWWDKTLQENFKPEYQYPRASTHALAQVLRLGFIVRSQARQTAPKSPSILVITNASDASVRNDMTANLVDQWQAHGTQIAIQEFDASLELRHDLIDPTQPYQQIELVYPMLMDWIAGKMQINVEDYEQAVRNDKSIRLYDQNTYESSSADLDILEAMLHQKLHTFELLRCTGVLVSLRCK